MSRLTIYSQEQPNTPLLDSEEGATIIESLAGVGICFQRWSADHEVAANDDNETILAAYKTEIDKLVAEDGYQSWDVVSMHANHPDKEAFRAKFLAEHTHSEDEVRFFVRGQGLFVIHKEEKVYAVLCEKDDLISVPANTKHWFDMGPNPVFTAIRLFNNTEGWVIRKCSSSIR